MVEDQRQTLQFVPDTAQNSYVDRIGDLEWLKATVAHLKREVEPHTSDVEIAIRGALDLLDGGIECFDWRAKDPGTAAHRVKAMLGEPDVSDASNLIVTTEAGAMFRVTVTRI